MNSLLFAAGGSTAGTAAGNANPILSFLPFIALILIMYFLMIRPQSKKQKEKQNMLNDLKPGDEILTIGGIYGKIEGVREKDDILIVRISKDNKLHIARSAVSAKVDKKVIV